MYREGGTIAFHRRLKHFSREHGHLARRVRATVCMRVRLSAHEAQVSPWGLILLAQQFMVQAFVVTVCRWLPLSLPAGALTPTASLWEGSPFPDDGAAPNPPPGALLSWSRIFSRPLSARFIAEACPSRFVDAPQPPRTENE